MTVSGIIIHSMKSNKKSLGGAPIGWLIYVMPLSIDPRFYIDLSPNAPTFHNCIPNDPLFLLFWSKVSCKIIKFRRKKNCIYHCEIFPKKVKIAQILCNFTSNHPLFLSVTQWPLFCKKLVTDSPLISYVGRSTQVKKKKKKLYISQQNFSKKKSKLARFCVILHSMTCLFCFDLSLNDPFFARNLSLIALWLHMLAGAPKSLYYMSTPPPKKKNY